MLRHTALFQWQHTTEDPAKLIALKGLAYLSFASPSVRSVDFGTDIFGGSERLRQVQPWKRTPLWNAREDGPPAGFDMALHLDFEDVDGLEEYNSDDAHHEVAIYNASVCRGEFTARVDWYYEGTIRSSRFGARHTSLFLWQDDVDDATRSDVRSALQSVGSIPGVDSVAVADNVGTLTTDYDMILDVMLEDAAAAKTFIDHQATSEAFSHAASATKHEWTARITHRMGTG